MKLFAGIDLDSRARAACAAVSERLQTQAFPARFEDAAKFHITLAFLGYVGPEEYAGVRGAAERAACACAPFTIVLDRIGAFPNERDPHIVWIGSRAQPTQFRVLVQALRSQFESLGFRFDKPAVAHVTIGRAKTKGAHLPLLEVAPIRVGVNAVTLFESIPESRTTRYEVRSRVPLSANG